MKMNGGTNNHEVKKLVVKCPRDGKLRGENIHSEKCRGGRNGLDVNQPGVKYPGGEK